MAEELPPVGVIGGSGLYALLDAEDEVRVETPYGDASDPVVLARVGSRRVAFLPRHGRDHRFPPHLVPYRANLWALHSLGVREVLAPSAVGGLAASLAPGDLVVPDQLFDRTVGRPSTFYDSPVVHVPFAEPYCPRLRGAVRDSAVGAGWAAVDGGTLAVIQGPRFSSRAESLWLRDSVGASIVGMTALPEAALARELALCYATVAVVTDRDAGTEDGSHEAVTMAEVLRVFAASVDRLRGVLLEAVSRLPVDGSRDCACPHALDGTPAAGT